MRSAVSWMGLVLSLASSGCSDDEPAPIECIDPPELESALAGASSGDVLDLCPTDFVGTFRVPAGVTVQRVATTGDAGGTVLLRPPEDASDTTLTVAITPGDPPPTLRNLSVGALGGGVAIGATGAGAVHVEDVTVLVGEGTGIMLDGVSDARLNRVSISGSFMPATDIGIPTSRVESVCMQSRCSRVVLEDVDATACFPGLVFEGGELRWTGGSAIDHGAVALSTDGTTSTLEDVELGALSAGTLTRVSAAQFVNGSVVSTTRVRVEGSDGSAMLHDASEAEHVDLVAQNGNDFAVSAQNLSSVVIRGDSTLFAGNRGGGVDADGVMRLEIRDATIRDSTLVSRSFGKVGTIMIGDGIAIERPPAGLVIENVSLDNNARVGAVIDLDGGTLDSATIGGVTVDGTDGQLGFVLQNGTIVPGWDSGVTRLGATTANDAALVDPLRFPGPGTVQPPRPPTPVCVP